MKGGGGRKEEGSNAGTHLFHRVGFRGTFHGSDLIKGSECKNLKVAQPSRSTNSIIIIPISQKVWCPYEPQPDPLKYLYASRTPHGVPPPRAPGTAQLLDFSATTQVPGWKAGEVVSEYPNLPEILFFLDHVSELSAAEGTLSGSQISRIQKLVRARTCARFRCPFSDLFHLKNIIAVITIGSQRVVT